MVLCAGLGTRLAPLTSELPKPMLPIGDRSQLAHVLEHLVNQGSERVVINTHHLPNRFSGVTVPGLAVRLLFESDLLGTAGGVANARPHVRAPLVVWNGDILARPELVRLRERAEEAGLCLLAAPAPAGSPGTLGLDALGHVARLRGERFGDELRGANYLGILALGSEALSRLPERGCLIGDVCLPWLRQGRPIPTLSYHGPWTDIGTLAEFQRANLAWLAEHELRAYVAKGARVAAGVDLERSIVHTGAEVRGVGALSRCIVFPGAVVVAPAADAIVFDGRVLGVSS
jgi:mannose-1-phosphate guanylyltransferase